MKSLIFRFVIFVLINVHYSFASLPKTITKFAILPNGFIASASLDRTIHITDLSSKRVVSVLRGHESGIRCLAVLPNGQLVSASDDATIKIWNVEKATLLRSISNNRAILSLALLPKGDIATGDTDGLVKIWNAQDGSLKKSFKAPGTGTVVFLQALANGDLVSGQVYGTVGVISANDNTVLRSFESEPGLIAYGFTLVNQNQLAVGTSSSTMKVFNLADGSLLKTITGQTYNADTLLYLENGYLATGDYHLGKEHVVKLWDLKSGSLVRQFGGNLAHRNSVSALIMSQTGHLISGDMSGYIFIWNFFDGSRIGVVPAHRY